MRPAALEGSSSSSLRPRVTDPFDDAPVLQHSDLTSGSSRARCGRSAAPSASPSFALSRPLGRAGCCSGSQSWMLRKRVA